MYNWYVRKIEKDHDFVWIVANKNCNWQLNEKSV